MSGAAMSLPAAATGFVIFLLSVQAAHPQSVCRVTYTSPAYTCALKGSTVEIRCTYSCTFSIDTKVERTFWFRQQDGEPVDLRTQPQYAGRVQYHCYHNDCTLTITDLRESDSAVYKFRFITNQPGGRYAGTPGVTLYVTDLHVQTSHTYTLSSWRDLKCHSSCDLPHHPTYIWYKNEEKVKAHTPYGDRIKKDSYYCALNRHEKYHSSSGCVDDDQYCHRVTYDDRRICAFKGSSVDISCWYNTDKYTSRFWFSPERSRRWRYPSQPEDLRKDSQYRDRVKVSLTEGGRSTLTISDLRESDSAEYHFKFKSGYFKRENSLPGTTLTVTDPDLEVQVIWTAAGPKLICYSSCVLGGRSPFTWFRNDTVIQGETSSSYGGNVDPADSYFCAYHGHRSIPVYVPKVPVVSMSFSGDIMENSSLTLTCSSDANPRPTYTWYKNKEKLPREGQQLVFSSIQSSDSGEYDCTIENELGSRTSKSVFIDVKYAPRLPSVSVSPAEIVEGSSVNLTCSSDANPAASYTWYKENQTLFHGSEGKYHFPSISFEDSGIYYCKTENKYRKINSTSLFLDVQYPPRLPSVSVSPSEIVEGSSVNLTCSSDANPAASYTWYKENEDSPKASGQIFTITDFRAEHSGNYYCGAQNSRGRRNSTLHLTVVTGASASAAAGTISALLLALILLALFLWIRKNKFFKQQPNCGERPNTGTQLNLCPVYDVPPPAAGRRPAEEQDDLHYSSIRFSPNLEDALYSNIGAVQPRRQTEEEEEEEEEEDSVEYTTVKPGSDSSDSGATCQEDSEELFALYSTVNK